MLEELIEGSKQGNGDGLTMESEKVQTRIAKTMSELAQYQQLVGVFTKPYVIANAKEMPPAVWWATTASTCRISPLSRGACSRSRSHVY